MHHHREATGERPEEAGKNPQTRETTHQKDTRPRGRRGAKRKLILRALHGAALVRARRGQRRPKNGDDEQKKGGGQRRRSTVAPSRETEATICVSRRNLPLGTAWKLWPGPSLFIY